MVVVSAEGLACLHRVASYAAATGGGAEDEAEGEAAGEIAVRLGRLAHGVGS